MVTIVCLNRGHCCKDPDYDAEMDYQLFSCLLAAQADQRLKSPFSL